MGGAIVAVSSGIFWYYHLLTACQSDYRKDFFY